MEIPKVIGGLPRWTDGDSVAKPLTEEQRSRLDAINQTPKPTEITTLENYFDPAAVEIRVKKLQEGI